MLSKQSVEILLDLVEIKLGAMQVQDREDARELVRVEKCRKELMSTLGSGKEERQGRKKTSLA